MTRISRRPGQRAKDIAEAVALREAMFPAGYEQVSSATDRSWWAFFKSLEAQARGVTRARNRPALDERYRRAIARALLNGQVELPERPKTSEWELVTNVGRYISHPQLRMRRLLELAGYRVEQSAGSAATAWTATCRIGSWPSGAAACTGTPGH